MNEHARLPASLFDDFVADRPDDERWELIEGSFVMQATPNIDHQVIVFNIARLLNDALESAGIERIALPGPTIDLTPIIAGNKFVPDVTVLDMADIVPDRHTTTRCYLAVEIVSASDRRRLDRGGRTTIEIKRDGYARLPDCEAILVVEQKRYAVRIGLRDGEDWSWAMLTDAADEVVLPIFGLRCRLGDFYARTSLALGRIKQRPSRR